MIEIVNQPIDTNQVLQSVQSDRAGAAILFVGTTRQFTDGRETSSLDYECYHEMAIKKLSQLRYRAYEKWPLEHCTIVHRIGAVPVGQTSVAIAVSTAHRVDSFEAGQWLIDTLKKEVPIWKRECYIDGQQEWVHPESTNEDSNAVPMQATENQDSTSKPVAEVKTELRAKELQTRDTNFEKAPQIRP
jgi:molybdopterin synthase catalytic subunit